MEFPWPVGMPKVTPIVGEQFRYHVASSRPDEPDYLVDVEARWPETRCTCRAYECKLWPEFRTTLTPHWCKHSKAALLYHALRHIAETSTHLKNNDGE